MKVKSCLHYLCFWCKYSPIFHHSERRICSYAQKKLWARFASEFLQLWTLKNFSNFFKVHSISAVPSEWNVTWSSYSTRQDLNSTLISAYIDFTLILPAWMLFRSFVLVLSFWSLVFSFEGKNFVIRSNIFLSYNV